MTGFSYVSYTKLSYLLNLSVNLFGHRKSVFFIIAAFKFL
jgi:hypothetical protein